MANPTVIEPETLAAMQSPGQDAAQVSRGMAKSAPQETQGVPPGRGALPSNAEPLGPNMAQTIREGNAPRQDIEDIRSLVASGELYLREEDQDLADLLAPSPVEQPDTEEPSVFEDAKKAVTGEDYYVESTWALPDWSEMPEMSDMTVGSLLNNLGTMATDFDETVQILQSSNPEMKPRKDEKGNYIFKSAIDGKEYGYRHGMQIGDVKKGVLTGAVYSMAAAAAVGSGPLAVLAAAGLTTGAMEGIQAMMGGDFDWREIPLSMITEGLGLGLGRAASGLKKGGVFSRTPSAKETIVKEAKKAGVDMMTSDAFPPETWLGKWTRAMTERTLGGTGKRRVGQQAQRVEMVENAIRSFGADAGGFPLDDIADNLLKKHARDYVRYNGHKTEIIERLSQTAAEDAVIMVPVDKATNAIKEGIEELSKRRTTEAQKAIDILTEYGDAFQNSNLSNLEALRKELGEKLKSPDLATVRNTAEQQLSKIYGALNEDMGDFITQTGGLKDFKKWKNANKNLSAMMNDMKVRSLKQALKEGKATPEVVQRMVFSLKPSELKLLYKKLTIKGKNSVKIALMQRAAQKSGAIDPATGLLDIENLSTAKFLSELNKIQTPIGVMFKQEEKDMIHGMMKALKHTKQAEIAGVKPITGAESTPFLLMQALSKFFTGTGKLLAGAVGIGWTAQLYESKAVRNILLKLAKTKPGKEQVLIQHLTRALQVYRGTSEGKKNINRYLPESLKQDNK